MRLTLLILIIVARPLVSYGEGSTAALIDLAKVSDDQVGGKSCPKPGIEIDSKRVNFLALAKASTIPVEACARGLKPEDVAAPLHNLSEVIEQGFVSGGLSDEETKIPPFVTHVDLHSSIEAYWARATASRLAGDAESKTRMKDVDIPALLRMRDYLRKSQQTLPYDTAWMLMLLKEIQRGHHSAEAQKFLQTMKDEIVTRSLKQFPELSREGGTGYYSSWVFQLYALKSVEPLSEANTRQLNRFIQSQTPALKAIYDDKSPRTSDAGMFVNAGALAGLLLNRPPQLPTPTIREFKYQPGVNDHVIGSLAMNLWAKGQDARGNRGEKCVAFVNELNSFLSRPEFWAGDFQNVSHWVPQFLVKAISSAIAGPE